jgi:hypothetical protein
MIAFKEREMAQVSVIPDVSGRGWFQQTWVSERDAEASTPYGGISGPLVEDS